jgi:GNAT superfamily N-acetyltransferase
VSGYPVELEEDVVLDDGRQVHVRPIRPDDLEDLVAAIQHADADTLRRRFLGGGAPHSAAALTRLVTVDYVRRFALVARSPKGQGVGIARYEGEGSWPTVEVAAVVDPAWRGVGLGRELVRRVVTRAIDMGATRLAADFFADNRQVAALIAEAGLPETRHLERGVIAEDIDLRPLMRPARLGSGMASTAERS